jgi:hypothetical protein
MPQVYVIFALICLRDLSDLRQVDPRAIWLETAIRILVPEVVAAGAAEAAATTTLAGESATNVRSLFLAYSSVNNVIGGQVGHLARLVS